MADRDRQRIGRVRPGQRDARQLMAHHVLDLPLVGFGLVAPFGLVGLALAHWFWQEGVAEIGAARAGVYLYLEPIATTARCAVRTCSPLRRW